MEPLEMPLINREINHILTWASTCVIINSIGTKTFSVTDTKVYVPVVTLSNQHNAKKSGFKRTVNWNKYQSEPKHWHKNNFLNYLIDLSFQGVNRLFYCYLKMMQLKQVKQDLFLRL